MLLSRYIKNIMNSQSQSHTTAKRAYCQHCERPEKACICKFSCNITNDVKVLVLQHPSEVKQTKGTVSLLSMSLTDIDVVVGEDFTDNAMVNAFILQHSPCYLLYPKDNAQVIVPVSERTADFKSPKSIIIIDGTWKKAYRMFQLSQNLQALPSLVLPSGIESHYEIRKTKKQQALSSLEACINALALLEENQAKYQPLLDNFVKFNQFQLSFTPNRTLSKPE